MDDEDRIALFIDYENVALGARDYLGEPFDLAPIAEELAARGGVVVRRAYADWTNFSEDRRMLTRGHVELIEIPQRMGATRKNAADIKMAVDAIELAFERDYINTVAVVTGDSDFTPLVHKLRELNKRVIGFGVRKSTSALLPPACDEFVFYDDLVDEEDGDTRPVAAPPASSTGTNAAAGAPGGGAPGRNGTSGSIPATNGAQANGADDDASVAGRSADLARLVPQAIAALQRSSGGPVTASMLKRTLLRMDPTFSEASYGFRAFGELLDNLSQRGVVELSPGPAKGDPEVTLPTHGRLAEAFELLARIVREDDDGEGTALSGLKDRIRAEWDGFSEKALGYSSFLRFCRAAESAGLLTLTPDESGGGYRLRAVGP